MDDGRKIGHSRQSDTPPEESVRLQHFSMRSGGRYPFRGEKSAQRELPCILELVNRSRSAPEGRFSLGEHSHLEDDRTLWCRRRRPCFHKHHPSSQPARAGGGREPARELVKEASVSPDSPAAAAALPSYGSARLGLLLLTSSATTAAGRAVPLSPPLTRRSPTVGSCSDKKECFSGLFEILPADNEISKLYHELPWPTLTAAVPSPSLGARSYVSQTLLSGCLLLFLLKNDCDSERNCREDAIHRSGDIHEFCQSGSILSFGEIRSDVCRRWSAMV